MPSPSGGLEGPGDDLDERGLALAVASHETDLLVGVEREGRAVEHDVRAEGMGHVGDGEQGHER